MKILYITPKGIKVDNFTDPEGKNPHDMGSISKTISEGIESSFSDVDVTILRDILIDDLHVSVDALKDYDLFLCDLTTSNPNISYLSGIVQGLDRPIIYFATSESSIPMTLSDKRILRYSDASLDEKFREELNQLIGLAKDDPEKFIQAQR